MQRIGVDYDLVAEAADKLTAQGEVPTIDRVRVFLGGTGSNTTISKYLHLWRNKTASGQKTELVNSINPPDPVQLAVKRVWQQLREETEAEIEAIKTSTQLLLTESEENAEVMAKECEKLTASCAGYQEQLRCLEAKSAVQQLDHNLLQREHDLLQERNKNLTQRYADLESTLAKQQSDLITAHQHEINLLGEKSNAQLSALEKLIDQQKRHADEKGDEDRHEIERLNTRHDKIVKDYERVQAVTVSKDLELMELKTQLTAVKKENDILSTQLQAQEKYWGLFEKNSQVTNNIWSELKDIPKFDLSLPYINILNNMQSHINFSMDNLGKVTSEARHTLEQFKNLSLTAKTE
jgi:chromosome segregation ATPase